MSKVIADGETKEKQLFEKTDDEQAVTELLVRYKWIVESEARKFAKTSSDFDDFVQEGMLGLLSAIRTFSCDRQVKFSTYASRCIRNRMINAVKQGENSANPFSDEEAYDIHPGPEDEFLLKEQAAETSRKLQELLTKLEKETLFLFLRGYSYEQTAEKLGTSRKAVDNALQRVRKKLKLIFGNV